MALSASTDFDLTARQIVQYALEKINILAKGEQVDVRRADPAVRELNMMLKEFMAYPGLWKTKEGFINLVNATASYALTPRPYRIIDVRFRQSSGIDIPMMELTKQEYQDLPQKTTAGIPTQWYFDPQQATSSIFVWPVKATVTTETLRVTYQRYLDDIDDLGNNIDIPAEWLSTLGYNLAARIADDYSRSGPAIDRIIARASALFERMADADRPEVVRFVPEHRYG